MYKISSCEQSAIKRYRGHIWRKTRFAGFRASYATAEIEELKPFFSDYRALAVLSPIGRIAARQWLSDRSADHDQLILESVRNENPDPASGSHVVAVSYARRTSDTLRALGFPDGIEPQAATKAVFTATDDRLRAFANGPFGGPIDLCKPGP